MSEAWPWVTLGALGAYHGLNPAMGWLFAVALGLQEQSRKAVLQALVPLALGHEAAIALVVLLVSVAHLVAAPQLLRAVGALALISFGVYKFLRPRSHPRWVGFRVSPPELALWSFLMSSAHGAGLMLVPVVLGLSNGDHAHASHTHAAQSPLSHIVDQGGVGGLSTLWLAQDLAAIFIHTLAMLLVMGAVALVVYEKFGVGFLRKAWLNLDGLWAGTIVAAGLVTLFTS
jgi:hypothetical protein